MKSKLRNKNIVLGICGSIAAYKVCNLIRVLKQDGNTVTCVLTFSGQKFITPLTLQTLSQRHVYTDLFEMYTFDPKHISLANACDLIIIAPATADIISRLACGRANDLLTSIVLSTKKPVFICPAMNRSMWLHPATQENIRRLIKFGYYIIGPEKGKLATEEEGIGRLASIETILKKISKHIR